MHRFVLLSLFVPQLVSVADAHGWVHQPFGHVRVPLQSELLRHGSPMPPPVAAQTNPRLLP